MLRRFAIATLVLAAGCDRSVETVETKRVGSAAPAADPLRGPTVHADLLLQAMVGHTGRALELESLTLSYVREDGTMDPQYGRFEAKLTSPPPPDPADDPDRPLGAPVPTGTSPAPPRTCASLSWAPGAGLEVERGSICVSFGSSPARLRCSASAVWARAIDQGAPRNALATLAIHAGLGSGTVWRFKIDDAPRGVSFSAIIDDDCEPIAESPVEK